MEHLMKVIAESISYEVQRHELEEDSLEEDSSTLAGKSAT